MARSLGEQLDVMRAHNAPAPEIAAREKELAELARRLQSVKERALAVTRRAKAEALPTELGKDAPTGLAQLLARDVAFARALPERTSELRAKLMRAASGRAERALRALHKRLSGMLRRARIGRIDAVMASKRRVELQIESLAAGRFPGRTARSRCSSRACSTTTRSTGRSRARIGPTSTKSAMASQTAISDSAAHSPQRAQVQRREGGVFEESLLLPAALSAAVGLAAVAHAEPPAPNAAPPSQRAAHERSVAAEPRVGGDRKLQLAPPENLESRLFLSDRPPERADSRKRREAALLEGMLKEREQARARSATSRRSRS